MSGHSKWHNIREHKSKVDAKKGDLFTKVSREILMAAKAGGPNPDTNFRLKMAILKAREVNMPADNIKRVIEKATGGDGSQMEEVTYEGYGPHGVAIIVEAATDNRNRTAAEMRNLFSRNGGALGALGCVAWMFDKRGIITITDPGATEDQILAAALEAGAEDVSATEDGFEVITTSVQLASVRTALEQAKVPVAKSEPAMIPTTTVALGPSEAPAVLRLMDALEAHDDTLQVSANFDIPADVLEALEG